MREPLLTEGKTGPDWEVRPYRPGDEVELASLFSQVFSKEVTPEWWMWKLKGRASPVENVWLAVSRGDGRIIGQYAGIPARLKLGDAVQDIMVVVDTMTAPDFRRRGVLTELGAKTLATWAEAGLVAVLGLPNEQLGSRTQALGWVGLFPLEWLRMPTRLDVLAANSGKIPHLLLPAIKWAGAIGSRVLRRLWQRRTWRNSGVSIEEVTSSANTTAFDMLWANLSGCYRNLIVRDGEWVRWRYLDAVGHRYRVLLARTDGELAGYLAYRVDASPGRAAGYIADIFTAPDAPNVARALLGTALDNLWQQKAGSVRATAVPGSTLHSLLSMVGFRPMSAAFGTMIIPFDPSLDVAKLSNGMSWHLTGGDFDVV